MPDKYIGKWDDGKTTMTFSKLFNIKQKLIKLMGFSEEQQQALAIYLNEVNIIFFGIDWETNFSNDKAFIDEMRKE